jgi:hypothetical protein
MRPRRGPQSKLNLKSDGGVQSSRTCTSSKSRSVSCSKQPVIRGHSLVLSFFIFDILTKISWTQRPILAPVVRF